MALLPEATIGSFFIGDVPASPSVITFTDETGEPVALDLFTAAHCTLIKPDGTDTAITSAVVNTFLLELTWPVLTVLNQPGIYSLDTQFENVGGVLVTAEPLRFSVEQLDGWLTLEQSRQQWQDAPVDDLLLTQILESAKAQCIAYAPALTPGAAVPITYVQAQLMQARALYQSVISNQNDNVGVDGYQVRLFPLDWNIKALLRPKRPIGGVR